ncbi:MAG: hypothetical protein ACE5LF_04740 [Alphaproteobacteria bacterium]
MAGPPSADGLGAHNRLDRFPPLRNDLGRRRVRAGERRNRRKGDNVEHDRRQSLAKRVLDTLAKISLNFNPSL